TEIEHRFPQKLLFTFARKPHPTNANQNTRLFEPHLDTLKYVVHTSEYAVSLSLGNNLLTNRCFTVFYMNQPAVDARSADRCCVLAVIQTWCLNLRAVHSCLMKIEFRFVKAAKVIDDCNHELQWKMGFEI